MDFLDPKAKKIRNIRLMIGYILVGILIITSTTILVFQAYGFDVDRKTGQVIQNGLVYIDSAPDGASLYLNGVLSKDSTNARLTLPEGTYDILIKKDGYRDWKRTIAIKGGSVERITYPFLVPSQLSENQISSFGKDTPILSTESPDRKWLLVSKGNSLLEYTEYDLSTPDNNNRIPEQRAITFPSGVLTKPEKTEKLSVIEWSTDNRHILVKHTYDSKFEYIIFDREEPTTSFNINKLLSLNPTQISLRDKKFDQWYLYTAKGGVLQTANAKRDINNVLQNVISYKTHDTSVILYAQTAEDGSYNIYLRQNEKTYMVSNVNKGRLHLNIARYDGAWYAAVGSDGDKKTYIYKNIAVEVKNSSSKKPTPVAILRAKKPINNVTFSTNTRFIMAQDNQGMGVYDAEKDEFYTYSIPSPMDKGTEATWMDGHRIMYRSGGLVAIFDFDSSNYQKLVGALPGETAFFDRDYTVIYTIDKPQSLNIAVLNSTDLRLVADK